MRRMIGGAIAALLLVGCGSPGDEPSPEVTTLEPTDPSTADPTESPAESPDDPADPTAANQDDWDERFGDLSDQERAAVDDLAERLDVAYHEISPAPLEEVTWPDGALGCPQPDQSYTQALVDGYRLLLDHRGETYAYHAGADGELAYCAEPTEPADGGRESR
ncbi:hypothetical protein [Ruania alba]|uniref:Uncharacterized protein n=1 Tax=Ruania alba TaxID=648782 RepID=A0A1H5M0Y8_9MICO|nr:hypothetical protein [Ruania alba]SEE82922.1 hypothetical protein SAMN04488554_3088 [Ruania alba]